MEIKINKAEPKKLRQGNDDDDDLDRRLCLTESMQVRRRDS